MEILLGVWLRFNEARGEASRKWLIGRVWLIGHGTLLQHGTNQLLAIFNALEYIVLVFAEQKVKIHGLRQVQQYRCYSGSIGIRFCQTSEIIEWAIKPLLLPNRVIETIRMLYM